VEDNSLFHVGMVALASQNPTEAYRCFSSVVEADSKRWDAWAGKAKAAGWMSTMANYRWPEMEACAKAAVALCPAGERPALVTSLTAETLQLAITMHNIAYEHVKNHGVIVLPEAFGMGVLKKAKPMPAVIDSYFNVVIAAITASANAIALAEAHSVGSAGLYKQLFSMAKNVFIHGAVVRPEASSGYGVVNLIFPMSKREMVDDLVGNLLANARNYDSSIPDPREESKAINAAAPKSGCYIATAALGTPDHPQLDVLRSFRDIVLASNVLGRAFIAIYYRLSPPLANLISKSIILRWITRIIVVRPSLRVARRSLQRHRREWS
jgi:hypothetical protein